ncbi:MULTISPECIES: hypothetical protein [Paraburkholderia]|jgi:uncharacterized cupredoxin-like copper-binding protein|uniref:hypothetical protein n=1 Tax=Paraburkholderia dipogonis TaxID=1211383 RepID=UPI0038B9ACDA
MRRHFILRNFAALGLGFAVSLGFAKEPPSVTVKLLDANNGKMSISLSPSTVGAGPIEFTIKNDSSVMRHEFMIVPWTGPANALPYDSKTQQVEEDRLQAMQGVEDLLPGQTVTVRLSLSQGRYVAFCNEPGHYRDAMSSLFTVNRTR